MQERLKHTAAYPSKSGRYIILSDRNTPGCVRVPISEAGNLIREIRRSVAQTKGGANVR